SRVLEHRHLDHVLLHVVRGLRRREQQEQRDVQHRARADRPARAVLQALEIEPCDIEAQRTALHGVATPFCRVAIAIRFAPAWRMLSSALFTDAYGVAVSARTTTSTPEFPGWAS